MEQFNSFTVPIKKEKMESLGVIIIADKRHHPLSSYDTSTVIETHINQILSINKNADIIYVGGDESLAVKKKTPIRAIENYEFTNTNDVSNIRLGMMANLSDTIMIIKCGAFVNNITMNRIINHNNNCTVAKNNQHKNLGTTITDQKINFIAFGLPYEWVPICLINKKQFVEFSDTVFSTLHNKMFHELLNQHLEKFELEAVI